MTDIPIYIRLIDAEVFRTEDVGGWGEVMIDFTRDGTIIGVEIIAPHEIRISKKDEGIPEEDRDEQ